jgi:hypothetical protein
MASGQAVVLWNAYRALDSQNGGVVIKNGPGEVGGWHLVNNAVGARYVKLYDKATAPTAADTPKLTLAVAQFAAGGLPTQLLGPCGIDFVNGISIRTVQGLADGDNTAPAAQDVQVHIFYK